MRAEEHREWRLSLGAYALGDLPEDERAAMEAHLEGCAECRAEAEALTVVGRLLPLADPARFTQPAPRPPAELGQRVQATIDAERLQVRRKKRRWRGFGLTLAGATAAAAAVLAIVVLAGGSEDSDGGAQHVAFGRLPAGIEIDAKLEPHAFGTEIHMYVSGVRSGTLCKVFLRDRRGRSFSAGSFRYRWGEDSQAVLSSALDLSRTRAVGVHAGGRTFIAPVGADATAAIENPTSEEPT